MHCSIRALICFDWVSVMEGTQTECIFVMAYVRPAQVLNLHCVEFAVANLATPHCRCCETSCTLDESHLQ
jgi:hypothetical protein